MSSATILSVDNVEQAAITVEHLLRTWGVPPNDWVLMDGHALVLAGRIEAVHVLWRNHLNVYVNEVRLPWETGEAEETIPPPDSGELQQLLQLLRNGIALHLVPAARYLKKGFETQSYQLPGGRAIQIATLRGLVRIWVWRAFEFWVQREQLGPDVDEISRLRKERLHVLLQAEVSSELKHAMEWLQRGYAALIRKEEDVAITSFKNANSALDHIQTDHE